MCNITIKQMPVSDHRSLYSKSQAYFLCLNKLTVLFTVKHNALSKKRVCFLVFA